MKAVYKLSNNVTGRFYIGSSSNLKHRIAQWKDWRNTCENPILRNDLEKYGFAGFTIEVLFECPNEWTRRMVELKEYEFIHALNPFYNTIGKRRPDDVRAKISKANTGKVQSEETKCKRHESIMRRHRTIPQTNSWNKILYWVEETQTLCVGQEPVCDIVGCTKHGIGKMFREGRKTIKGFHVSYFTYKSVETSWDECTSVGQVMSFCPKCATAGKTVEEIVRSVPMGKARVDDQGVLALARRSGEISTIQARVVYQNDEFDYEYGLKPYLRHKPFKGANRGPAVAYYATFTTKDGGDGFEVMWKDDVLEHAQRFSKSYYNGVFSGPWATDFDAMAKKTVLLAALKYAPKATDFARDIASDNLVKNYEPGKDMRDVRAEEVIDVDAEAAPVEKTDAERAHELADGLGLKKGSDLKPGEGEDLGDVE